MESAARRSDATSRFFCRRGRQPFRASCMVRANRSGLFTSPRGARRGERHLRVFGRRRRSITASSALRRHWTLRAAHRRISSQSRDGAACNTVFRHRSGLGSLRATAAAGRSHRLGVVGGLRQRREVLSLVEAEFVAAGQFEQRRETPAAVGNRCRFDPLGLELPHRCGDVVAH